MESLLRRRTPSPHALSLQPAQVQVPDNWAHPDFERANAAAREQLNQIATNHGLPGIGATMINAHGLQWQVCGHAFARTMSTASHDRQNQDPRDLYPVLALRNPSKRLLRLKREVDLCTPKQVVILDTLPELRAEASPHWHWMDGSSHSENLLVFLDAGRVSEIIIAHELAHAWIDLVEGIEDSRVLANVSDMTRYAQVQMLQSFVLDVRIGELLRSKGFELAEVQKDLLESVSQLARSLELGYRPPSRWEAVFMATSLASALIEEPTAAIAAECGYVDRIADLIPDEANLAKALAGIVCEHPPSSGANVTEAVNRILELCFAFAGEHLDIESDLVEVPPAVNWSQNKSPGWLDGLTPRQKCEIGKLMARTGVSPQSEVRLRTHGGVSIVDFSEDGASWAGGAILPFSVDQVIGPEQLANRVMAINEQNRRRLAEQHLRVPGKPAASPPGPRIRSIPAPRPPGLRPYGAGAARFATRVRLEQQLAGEAAYAYALDSPVTYVDRSGDAPTNLPSKSPRTLTALFCERPVHQGSVDSPYNHWFLEVPGCGSIGYGPDGLIPNYEANADNLPIQRVHCRPISVTASQAACLCHLKNLISIYQQSPKPIQDPYQQAFCRPWAGKGCYSPLSHNCQDFVRALLNHCGRPAPMKQPGFPTIGPFQG